ncbi:MAG: hypothetical protein ISP72_08265 [Flavobacteriaceae bacterium]|nr:hypothetical protein [Flavobacteriaceae bacterium]
MPLSDMIYNLVSDSNHLTITGYTDKDYKNKKSDYSLQTGPDSFDITIGDTVSSTSSTDSEGTSQTKNPPTRRLRQLKCTFLIDNTGLMPTLPQGCNSVGENIGLSLKLLKDIILTPDQEIHDSLFVGVQWGEFNFKGKCVAFSQNFTFFHNSTPLRAKIDLTLMGEIEADTATWRSPDITRIPTVTQGDSIAQLCEEYYQNRNYYIQIAKLNNLPTFRRLKEGQSIEFPPIKK